MNNIETNEQNKQQCTKCKVWRETPENFTGKKGQFVNTCKKCRDRGEEADKRQDRIYKKNKRQRERKYYQKTREKQRNENEKEYLDKNNENAKKWRDNNKEHLSAWRKNDFTTKYHSLKKGAIERGYNWSPELTELYCYDLCIKPCYYCGIKQENILNSLDRVDNSKGYSKENCVTCCGTCNKMKACVDIRTFLERNSHISKHSGNIGNYYTDISVDYSGVTYSGYKKRANRKNFIFDLTKEDFEEIRNKNCYYCDKTNSDTHKNGIDRKNSKIGYTLDNCVSCCGICNYMKNDIDSESFIEKCKMITENCQTIELPDNIERRLHPIIKRTNERKIEKTPINVISPQVKLKPERPPTPPTLTRDPKQRTYVKTQELPLYCSYLKPDKRSGSGYYVDKRHPMRHEFGTHWTTTRSKEVSDEEKYKQFLAYLNSEEYTPIKDVQPKPKEKRPSKALTPEDKFRLLTDEQLLTIINFKGKLDTAEASQYIKDNYQLYISRNFVSKLWLNQLNIQENIKNTEDYLKMCEDKTKRKLKPKKALKNKPLQGY